MLKNEAAWLRSAIERHLDGSAGTVIDLGSGTAAMREDVQPHISGLFAAVRQAGINVVTTDLRDGPGVDVVGDLYDPQVQAQLREVRPGSIFMFNVLEHVIDPGGLVEAVSSLVPDSGLVFVSVPHAFPYHPDPIDTRFRPALDELVALFPGAELVEGEIVPCGTYADQLWADKLRAFRDAVGLGLPYPSLEAWRSRRDRFRYLRRPYLVTCAVVRVRSAPSGHPAPA